jgi:dihydroorotate dehydrogenase
MKESHIKILLSPPFGSRFNPTWATRVMGTYTVHKRPGLIKQTIKTLRPVNGGWINQIGLRNSGICSVTKFDTKSIYSIAAIDSELEYNWLHKHIPKGTSVEINLSCPNLHSKPLLTNLNNFINKFELVIVKLPPPCVQYAYHWAESCYDMGVRHFHACNTLPTQRGGESGERLRPQSLKMVAWIRKNLPDTIIIGGGGIYHPDNVKEYREFGANYFSVSTVCFTPWKIPAIIKEANRVNI